MIKFKQGVTWQGVTPEIVLAIIAVGGIIAPMALDSTCWITSIRDSDHSASSRHYLGEAFDCRSKNLPPEKKHKALESIKLSLPGYYVDLEFEGLDNEHFHIQRNEGRL